MDFDTLAAVLAHRAAVQARQVAFRFLATGEEETDVLAFEDLHARATALARRLAALAGKGERALLVFAPGLEFVVAFFACMAAGLVAVPVPAPRRTQSFDKLRAIAADCDARLVLADAVLRPLLAERLCEGGLDARVALVDTSTLDGAPAAGEAALPVVTGADLAFLQYTSGSTGSPKGVCVSHRQILANSRMIVRGFAYDRDTVMVSWLPMFHDMGLIGSILQPVHTGFTCILMPPAAFVQKPVRWLRALSRWRATTTGGPNFGYDLCVQRVRDEDLAGLDLSAVRVAFNGAEPVRDATLRAFARRFGPCGFRADAPMPCYGLAEATLLVANAPAGTGARTLRVEPGACALGRAEPAPPAAADALAIVSCGVLPPGCGASLRIVDPDSGRPLADGAIGEICIAGDHVLAGYWSTAAAGPQPLGDKAWRDPGSGAAHLRTGDLGFVHAGELHVCGRLKDLIIVKGRNLFPQDIEARVEVEHEAFERNASAAFTIDDGTEERLVVLQEIRREHRHGLDAAECRARVRAAIAREFDVALHDIVFVPSLTLPKTSSGKIMRRSCRALYLERLAAPPAG